MNGLWLGIAIAAVGLIAAAVMSLRRGDESASLGSVSTQWISEHRLGQGQDSRR